MPSLLIVGSTKNQCPIIIKENTEDTIIIGNADINKVWPTKVYAPTAKLIKLKNKR